MTPAETQKPTVTGHPGPNGHAHEDPATQLRQMICGYRVSQAIHVAAVLGVADLLKDGPKDCDHLAKHTGTDDDALCRLLRGLTEIGIFAEVSPRQFALTPLASLLQTEIAGSQHALAVMLGQDWLWRPWGRLKDSIQTGEPTFSSVFGLPFFEYLQRNAHDRAIFQKALAGASTRAAVADIYDFSTARTVVDVGGGHGALIASILTRNPHARGVLFDRAAVLGAAKGFLDSAGVLDRCELVDGDFFDAVPGGADIYILSLVLHDWNDTAAAAILTNCRRVMAPDGKLLVVERVTTAQAQAMDSTNDLNMLVLMGGRERTQSEYDSLLSRAGLRTNRVLPMGESWSLTEATPAS